MHWDTTGQTIAAGDDPVLDDGWRVLVWFLNSTGRAREVPLHSHEFYEFVLIHKSSDNLHVTLYGETPLRRGDMLILAPGMAHAYRPVYGLYLTEALVQPQWFTYALKALWNEKGLITQLLSSSLFGLPADKGIWTLHLNEPETQQCEHEFDSMVKESLNREPSLTYLFACFLKMIVVANQNFIHGHGRADSFLPKEVWKIASIIEQAIESGNALKMDLLVHESGMCYKTISKAFKAATGASMTDYYQRRRIQHAKRLLAEEGQSVTEIAHNLGFSDTAHFIHSFKRATGVTPADFRKHKDEAAFPLPLPTNLR